jgi:hypothetical protein
MAAGCQLYMCLGGVGLCIAAVVLVLYQYPARP